MCGGFHFCGCRASAARRALTDTSAEYFRRAFDTHEGRRTDSSDTRARARTARSTWFVAVGRDDAAALRVAHIGLSWLSNARISTRQTRSPPKHQVGVSTAPRCDDQPTSAPFWRRAQRGAYRPALALDPHSIGARAARQSSTRSKSVGECSPPRRLRRNATSDESGVERLYVKLKCLSNAPTAGSPTTRPTRHKRRAGVARLGGRKALRFRESCVRCVSIRCVTATEHSIPEKGDSWKQKNKITVTKLFFSLERVQRVQSAVLCEMCVQLMSHVD